MRSASGIRQRREQDRVDDSEDRGVCADAEREREDRDQSEPRRFAQLAKGVAEVVHRNSRVSSFEFRLLHPCHMSLVTGILFIRRAV